MFALYIFSQILGKSKSAMGKLNPAQKLLVSILWNLKATISVYLWYPRKPEGFIGLTCILLGPQYFKLTFDSFN